MMPVLTDRPRFIARRRRLAGVGSIAVLGVLIAAGSAPARAAITPPSGENTGTGYAVQVQITFSGEGAKGGGTYTKGVSVSPTCWWQPATPNNDYTDAKASLDWYDDVTDGGAQTRGNIGLYGPRRIWEDAVKVEEGGGDISWYRAFCKDPADYERYNAGSNEEVDPLPGNPENFVTYYYRAFDAGVQPPAPLIDAEELARAAYDELDIPLPVTDRNPKIGAGAQPTLVGLETWFWLDQQHLRAAGGPDGIMEITAAVGPVSATVRAVTTHVQLTSSAGGTQCDPKQVLVPYATGTAETNACTLQFTRASKGNQLTASTRWEANWTSNQAGEPGGGLADLVRTVTSNVPVAEVQNIVTR